MSGLFSLARPLLHALEAETAHGLTIAALKSGLAPRVTVPRDKRLHVSCFGLDFPNPLGLAAGFDKNAEVPDAMLAQGFGFVEIGSVTPRPQAGNDRPRLFRLAEDKAVINRMGFNNDGHTRVFARLTDRAGRGGIVGVNLGANKDFSRSHRRLCNRCCGLQQGGELHHRQRVLAKHAGPARLAVEG